MEKIIFKVKEIVDPILELYRGKLYCQIIKVFINLAITNLGTEIFSVKKSYPRTLTNILSSWMFTLYAFESNNKSAQCDVFFPDNFENTNILKKILLDYCKHDISIDNIEEKVNTILQSFVEYIKEQMDTLKKYKVSPFYLNSKNDYQIVKSKITQSRNDEVILFYKFKIVVHFGIKDKRLLNILNNILLPVDVYNKMKNNYTGDNKIFDIVIWIIIFRYQLLGSNNHQLGILPNIINKMKEDYNLNFECFASSINSTLKNYCSIYYDLEKYFGSKGNFFNIELEMGTYSFNPPYQKEIIDNGINRILNFLDKTTKPLTFIMTIPVWDKEGQESLQEISKIDYGDFEIIEKIKSSKYYKTIRIISKNEFTYLDHNFRLYKNKTIQNTYIILLSNDNNIDIQKIEEYNFML